MLHPDLAHRIVLGAQPIIGEATGASTARLRAFEQQAQWARDRTAGEPDLGLVIMAHTHHAAVSDIGPGRQYLNPGAWFDGFRYAIATADGATLHNFNLPH